MNKPAYHIFVCSSSRINGQQKGFCISKNAAGLAGRFLDEIADRELSQAMVTNTGCLSLCSQGPVVVIYPQGVWYGGVGVDDVEEILDAMENGEIVARLAL